MPSIDAVVARAAAAVPNRIAAREWESGKSVTYAALNAATSALAGWFAARRVGPGAAVAIHLPNSIDFLIAKFGAFRSGAAAAYINFRLSPTEAARQIRLSGAKAVVAPAAKVVALRDMPEMKELLFITSGAATSSDERLDDIISHGGSSFAALDGLEDADALIRFTSGSTGLPKGVVVSHRAWLVRAQSILAEEIRILPGSTTLTLGPLSHGAGLLILPTVLRHGTLLILDKFDVEVLSDILTTEQISCTEMVPTMLSMMMEAPRQREALQRSGLHQLIYGGSPIRASLVDELLDLLPGTDLVNSYGSHEAGSISYLSGVDHRDPHIRRSVGRPYLPVGLRIARADPDGVGEIEVSAPWLPHARLNEKGREVLETSWVGTGDLGEIHDGVLFLRDRLNDVIISGGFNVYPAEVESVIDSHKSVCSSVVVSAPDDRWGERVIAYVLPHRSAALDLAALRAHCRTYLAGYKVPREFFLVEDIPLNPNGKPDRRRISDPLWNGQTRRI